MALIVTGQLLPFAEAAPAEEAAAAAAPALEQKPDRQAGLEALLGPGYRDPTQAQVLVCLLGRSSPHDPTEPASLLPDVPGSGVRLPGVPLPPCLQRELTVIRQSGSPAVHALASTE